MFTNELKNPENLHAVISCAEANFCYVYVKPYVPDICAGTNHLSLFHELAPHVGKYVQKPLYNHKLCLELIWVSPLAPFLSRKSLGMPEIIFENVYNTAHILITKL